MKNYFPCYENYNIQRSALTGFHVGGLCWSNSNLEMLVGKPEKPGKNPEFAVGSRVAPSSHMAPGHIDGRRLHLLLVSRVQRPLS